jgi:hypothetical protein
MAKNYKDIKVDIPFTIGDIMVLYHSLKEYNERLKAEITAIDKWVPKDEEWGLTYLDLQVMRTDRLMALEENLESTERALSKVMTYMRHPL